VRRFILQNKAGTNSVSKNGSYKISNDGTLTQKMICQKGCLADDAEIEFLDVENLILKLEFGKSILSEDEKTTVTVRFVACAAQKIKLLLNSLSVFYGRTD
jgi:hypothetical protein